LRLPIAMPRSVRSCALVTMSFYRLSPRAARRGISGAHPSSERRRRNAQLHSISRMRECHEAVSRQVNVCQQYFHHDASDWDEKLDWSARFKKRRKAHQHDLSCEVRESASSSPQDLLRDTFGHSRLGRQGSGRSGTPPVTPISRKSPAVRSSFQWNQYEPQTQGIYCAFSEEPE